MAKVLLRVKENDGTISTFYDYGDMPPQGDLRRLLCASCHLDPVKIKGATCANCVEKKRKKEENLKSFLDSRKKGV